MMEAVKEKKKKPSLSYEGDDGGGIMKGLLCKAAKGSRSLVSVKL